MSSLGLNRIKTRSGPLPQESFFSFGKESRNAKVGASNLLKTKKEDEKEKDLCEQVKAWEKTPSGGGGGVGGLGWSRLQNSESSSEATSNSIYEHP